MPIPIPKTGPPQSVKEALKRGFYSTTQWAVPAALLLGGALGLSAGKKLLMEDPSRKKIVDDLSKKDPIISKYSKKEIMKNYETLVRFAPKAALDPNVTTAYLRNALQFGGIVDYTAAKSLAELEEKHTKLSPVIQLLNLSKGVR